MFNMLSRKKTRSEMRTERFKNIVDGAKKGGSLGGSVASPFGKGVEGTIIGGGLGAGFGGFQKVEPRKKLFNWKK